METPHPSIIQNLTLHNNLPTNTHHQQTCCPFPGVLLCLLHINQEQAPKDYQWGLNTLECHCTTLEHSKQYCIGHVGDYRILNSLDYNRTLIKEKY